MRFVLAIVSFVVAAVMIVAGIAQRTIFAEPDKVALSTVVTTESPVTVIDGDTLNAFEGSQTLSVQGPGTVFAAYGRTTDVLAWIGDASYTTVSLDKETGELTSTLTRGTETEVPDPNGSDLWLDDFVKDNDLSMTVKVPSNVSIIIASDAAREPYAGAVALGCVIRGETYHFEIVSNECCRALTDLALFRRLALGNGVLTVENEAQAIERADPARGDKGGDAARAALALHRLKRKIGAA